MKKIPQKNGANRRNLHFKTPSIYDAFQLAIEQGIINAKSASARVEELIRADVKRLAPKFRAAGIAIPEEVFAEKRVRNTTAIGALPKKSR